MSIQSILFPVDDFTKATANKWLIANGHKVVFEGKDKGKTKTEHYYRYRQLMPKKNKKYRTITIDKQKGVKAIVEYPK